jgi:hypothetical protein
MKYNLLLLLALVALAFPAKAESDFYRIRVTREESNFYSVNGSSLLVQTEMCLELALGTSALLVWEYRGSWNNKLVFLDYRGKTKGVCRVKRLLAEVEP